MKNVLIVLGLLFMVASCGKPEFKAELEGEFFLNVEDQRIIPINSKSSNFSLLSQVWESNAQESFLIRVNYFDSDPNYLFVNSLIDSTLDLALEYEVEGPNGVGNVSEFYFHSFDSIFLVDRYRYLVSLADSSGKVLRSYRLKGDGSNMPDETSVLPWSTSKARIFKRGNSLFIPGIPDKDPYLSHYQKENLLVELNLETGDYSNLLGYPRSYQNGKFWGGPDHILPSISPYQDLDLFLVSYPLTDSIFLFNIKSKKLSPFKLMGSKNKENPIPISFEDSQTDRGRAFQLGTDYYFSINYNPTKNEIWRIFYKGYDEESIKKMLSRESGNPNQKSVLRLNEEINTLGEVELPSDLKVNPYDLIFFREGGFISLDSLEDRLIYKKIEFR